VGDRPDVREDRAGDTDSLVSRYETLVDLLASKGIDRALLLRNSLITASCGTGSVPSSEARRIAVETRAVSDRLKERHAGPQNDRDRLSTDRCSAAAPASSPVPSSTPS